MVQVWYMNDNDDEDQRGDRHLSPPQFITLEELTQKTGVLYWNVDADKHEKDPFYAKIRMDRGYSFQDQVELSKEKLPNYDDKMKIFYTEHFHADEEIRFVLAGSGFFDVRDKEDKWIRIALQKNDLIALPAGIYHRFTLDFNGYIKVNRLFVGEPVWTAINRPAEEHPVRAQYLAAVSAN